MGFRGCVLFFWIFLWVKPYIRSTFKPSSNSLATQAPGEETYPKAPAVSHAAAALDFTSRSGLSPITWPLRAWHCAYYPDQE